MKEDARIKKRQKRANLTYVEKDRTHERNKTTKTESMASRVNENRNWTKN